MINHMDTYNTYERKLQYHFNIFCNICLRDMPNKLQKHFIYMKLLS